MEAALAPLHPIVVHFAIGLLVAGALLRLLSLLGRPAFADGAAAALLLAGTLAAVLAAQSGEAAHGPVERVPGSNAAVHEHEEWGERTRNVFLAVAAAELAALWLARRQKARPALYVSAALCLGGLFCLYEAGEHGGQLVYSYAGGVGIRTGAPEDVNRLLLAAAYHQAQLDRKEGRPQDAASVIAEAARRFPGDAGVQMLAAESLLLDRGDPAAALEAMGRIAVKPDDARARTRHGLLTADAQLAAGQKDAARATLTKLAADFPQSQRVKQKLDALSR
jgi:uncharacterized membrane protein